MHEKKKYHRRILLLYRDRVRCGREKQKSRSERARAKKKAKKKKEEAKKVKTVFVISNTPVYI